MSGLTRIKVILIFRRDLRENKHAIFNFHAAHYTTGPPLLGNQCNGPDSCQSGDLIPQAIDKDRHTLGQLVHESITHAGNDVAPDVM